MKVSGFSFIKDALIYDYPVSEAIRSILPMCDEFVVAVGKSRDDTLNLIMNIDKNKIRVIETEWDETIRTGGAVLALETDKAFANIAPDSDWAFYIQGDEVVHEKYLDRIYQKMLLHKDDTSVDGMLFDYLHFYGSYDYICESSNWYKHEIRVIKNDRSIYSYKDAQGFRKGNNVKLSVVPADACVFHYGWIREPKAMQRKQVNFHKYWHGDQWIENHVVQADEFEYGRHLRELVAFTGEHPEVMKERIAMKNWKFDCDLSISRKSIKDRVKAFAAKSLRLDFNHRNYKIIEPLVKG